MSMPSLLPLDDGPDDAERGEPSLAALSACARTGPTRLLRTDELWDVVIEYDVPPEGPAEPSPPGARLRLVPLPAQDVP